MTKRLPQNYSARPRLGARAAGVLNNFPMYLTAFFEAARRTARMRLVCLSPRTYRECFAAFLVVNFGVRIYFLFKGVAAGDMIVVTSR